MIFFFPHSHTEANLASEILHEGLLLHSPIFDWKTVFLFRRNTPARLSSLSHESVADIAIGPMNADVHSLVLGDAIS